MNNPEFLTALGAALSIFLSSAGSSFGSIHAGIFAVRSVPDKRWGKKAFIPIIVAGVLAIYGIIVAVILCGKLTTNNVLTESDGYRNLCAGLAVGLACLSSGFGLGHFMKSQTTKPTILSLGQGQTEPLLMTSLEEPIQPQGSVLVTVLVLCYIEAIGLYGLIVGLILSGGSSAVEATS